MAEVGSSNAVNTNGKNIQQLKAFASGVPLGLTADSSDNKLYWTKRTGKIQRSNFAGRYVKDIVSGLPKPGSLALGVETVARQRRLRRRNHRRTRSRRRRRRRHQILLNTMSTVTVRLIISTLPLSPLALGTDNLDYDVNGDGSVDANGPSRGHRQLR